MTTDFATIDIGPNRANCSNRLVRRLGVTGLETWIAGAILGLSIFFAYPVFAEKIKVVYPRAKYSSDGRANYQIALLDLAMRKAGVEYDLYPTSIFMQQNRALQQLTANDEISVVWSMTTTAREKDLLPIRIPIDKGLLGWRIFLINKNDAPQFEQLQTLEQLKPFAAGQEHDWPDIQILSANGLKVYASIDYASLFKMLRAGRIDYVPRSIVEIWGEQQAHQDMDFAVEKSIVLQYPAAEYFFVNKNNKPLATALEKGLRAAIKDGSFEKIFTKYNGEAIKRANIKNRKLFKLRNPDLPEETPLTEKELWLVQNKSAAK